MERAGGKRKSSGDSLSYEFVDSDMKHCGDRINQKEETTMLFEKRRALCISAVMFMLFFGISYASAEVGVTDKEIKIGGILDLSGPIAFMGKSVSDGSKLYFKYINDKGGVHGRQINYLVEDDGYKAPRAIQAVKKLITKDKVFCLFSVLGSAQCNAMYPILESQGIPLVLPATQNQEMGVPPRKYLFLADPTYTLQGKVAVEYVVEDLGVKKPKIACMFQDDTPGHDWRNGVRTGTKHFGLDVLELPYKRGTVDFSSQIAKCKDAGVTHLLIWALIREPGIMMKEAQRLNYKPTFIFSTPSISQKVLQLAGDTLDFNGEIYGTSIWVDALREETPTVKLIKECIAKYGMGDINDTLFIYGFQSAITLVEGLDRTGKDLTREGLIKAFESFKGFDNGIFPPITWGTDRRAGSNSVKIFKVQGREWQSIMEGWRFTKIKE